MCHPQEVYDYKRVEMAHFNIGRQYQYWNTWNVKILKYKLVEFDVQVTVYRDIFL